jgi:hypothetical protein
LSVVREPNGRVARDKREFPPAQVRRLRDAALLKMADARWGTELGRLYLGEKIDDAMFAAGERWAELSRRYRAATLTPRELQSAALERGSLGTAPDPDSEAGVVVVLRDKGTVISWKRAHAVLCGAGLLAEHAVRSATERNDAVAEFEFQHLRAGLAALTKFWRFTDA